jgi:hypothetical protein
VVGVLQGMAAAVRGKVCLQRARPATGNLAAIRCPAMQRRPSTGICSPVSKPCSRRCRDCRPACRRQARRRSVHGVRKASSSLEAQECQPEAAGLQPRAAPGKDEGEEAGARKHLALLCIAQDS